MKRDLNLARAILQKIESCEDPWGLQEKPEISGYNSNEIAYHIKLLNEAGLIQGQDVSSLGPEGFDWVPGNLTWDGHEFLDAANDESIWDKAKESVLKPTASFTFDLLLQWLKLKAKEKIGLP